MKPVKPNQKNKIFVAVAGNIGAGKTTLTRMLSEKLGWKAYFERVIDNPYLSDFYKNMNRWSFHLQVFFLSNRFRSQKEISDWPDSCIQDRSIYEDAEIFAYTLHKQGFMSDRDYANYRDLFSIMVNYLRKPDLIVYLKAPLNCLITHIKKRGRSYEQTIDVDYLAQLNEAYDAWIERAPADGIKILTIDISNRNFEKNENDFKIIYQPIIEMEKQAWLSGV
jgi:deoxyadenosine/deoxycytidine kinase